MQERKRTRRQTQAHQSGEPARRRAERAEAAVEQWDGYEWMRVVLERAPRVQQRGLSGLLGASLGVRSLASELLFTSLEVGLQPAREAVALAEAGLPPRLLCGAADSGAAGASAALGRLMPSLERLSLACREAAAIAAPHLSSGAGKLRELSVSGCGYGQMPPPHSQLPQLSHALSSLTSLSRLEFRAWLVTAADVRALRPLGLLGSLHIGHLQPAAFAALPTQLTELRVGTERRLNSNTGWTGCRPAQAARALARTARLAVLDLGSYYCDLGIAALAALPLASTLVTLRLVLSRESLAAFVAAAAGGRPLLPRVSELSLDFGRQGPCAAAASPALGPAFPALRKLAFRNALAYEGGAPLLFDLPLEELAVSDCFITGGRPCDVRLGPHCRAALAALDLRNARVAPDDLGALPRLRRLRVSLVGLGPDHPAPFPAGLALPRLEELQLMFSPASAGPPPGSEALLLLRAAAASPALRRLATPACSPGLLASLLRGTPLLEELCVHGSAGPELLPALSGLPRLRRLSIRPAWRDAAAGLPPLAQALAGLRELELELCGIMPFDLSTLCRAIAPPLARMPHLERVSVGDSRRLRVGIPW